MSRDRSGSAQLPESIRSEVGVGVPKIISSEIDVLPPDGGKVSKQRVRDDFPAAAEVVKRTAEIHGVPQRAIAAVTVASPLARYCCASVADRAAHRGDESRQRGQGHCGIARFALVELDGHLPAECRQLELVEHEQRALDPTDFGQGQRQPF